MRKDIVELLADSPVIAAVRSEEQIEAAIRSSCKVVFLLFGDVCNVPDLVNQIQKHEKKVVVHVDLITGLGQKEAAIDYICQTANADGIISTRAHLVHRASAQGRFSALRVFAIDSMVEGNIKRELGKAKPDVVEILPGIIPKFITHLAGIVRLPIVAGGLIHDKTDVLTALGAGAWAVSTSREDLWEV